MSVSVVAKRTPELGLRYTKKGGRDSSAFFVTTRALLAIKNVKARHGKSHSGPHNGTCQSATCRLPVSPGNLKDYGDRLPLARLRQWTTSSSFGFN